MKMGDKTQIMTSEKTSGSPTGRKYTSLKSIKYIYKISTKFIKKIFWTPSKRIHRSQGPEIKNSAH